MSEQSIIGARASVMVYDDVQKKWVPSGTSSGLSKVQIFHHQQNNTFRVVGRKLQDHEVVINCSILKGLKYNQATATFHQWRDSKFVYGLNFSSQQDAEAFARAMTHALEVLSGKALQPTMPLPANGNAYDEDMGYRTMTREDAAILQQQNQISGNVTPSAQTPTSQNQNMSQSPPTPQGHHRTSSAPPAPQPPQMSMAPQIYNQNTNGPSIIQTQQQTTIQQQSQYHPSQVATQNHAVYSSHTPQQVNNSYSNQYQQPIYVSSSSNQGLNQQLPQSQPPQPPPHQNGTIYVSSSSAAHLAQGISSSSSSNSVVYASQQQQQQPYQQPQQQQQQQSTPPPQLQQQQQQQQQQHHQLQNITSNMPGYGQSNGPNTTVVDGQYNQMQIAPQMIQQMSGAVVSVPATGVLINRPAPIPPNPPQAPPPPPGFCTPNFIPSQIQQTQPQPPPPPSMNNSNINNNNINNNNCAPPPPPPPPMAGLGVKKDEPSASDISSLAAQLQNARLKRNNKNTPPPAENSGSSTSSGGSGNYGTIGRTSKGMASMMDEMAKTLARRRAQAEKKEPDPADDQSNSKQRPWEKSNTLPHKLSSNNNTTNSVASSGNINNSGGESPRPMRKRFGSASEETILKQVNGENLSLALSADLDSIKAEIVREMRLEIQKAKQDIIEAIKSEFNRR